MSEQGFRHSLGLPGLLKNMRQIFENIPDPKLGTTMRVVFA
jgi:hypothetical protein